MKNTVINQMTGKLYNSYSISKSKKNRVPFKGIELHPSFHMYSTRPTELDMLKGVWIYHFSVIKQYISDAMEQSEYFVKRIDPTGPTWGHYIYKYEYHIPIDAEVLSRLIANATLAKLSQ